MNFDLKICALVAVLALSSACIQINNITPPADGGDSQVEDDAGDLNDGGAEDDAGDLTDAGDEHDTDSPQDVGDTQDTGAEEDTGSDEEDTDPGTVPACDETFGQEDACGGDIVGDWTFESLCPQQTIEALALYSNCEDAELVEFEMSARGSMEVSASNFSRVVEVDVDAVAHIPLSCPSMLFGGCQGHENMVNSFSDLETTCVTNEAAGRCECDVTGTYVREANGGYTYNDGELNVDGVIYDVCAEGGGLTMRLRPDDPGARFLVEVYGR